MDNFGMCGLLINGVPLDTYEGAALLDYSVGETSIKNETFQGINRSTWHLLKSIYGLREIKITIVFTGPSRREVSLQRSKLNGALFGASELYISGDGFFYDVSVESCGPEVLVGEGAREVKIKSDYSFRGVRRDALVSETIPAGGSVFCNSTMPYTDARLTATIETEEEYEGQVINFKNSGNKSVSSLDADIPASLNGTSTLTVSQSNGSGQTSTDVLQLGKTVYGGSVETVAGELTEIWGGGAYNLASVPADLASIVEEEMTETTETGAIASFNCTLGEYPMKSVLCEIAPVQSGSGDPAPDNVRPISGFTGLTAYRTGKNLFNKDADGKQVGWAIDPVTFSPYQTGSGNYNLSDYVPIKGGQSYIASGTTHSCDVVFYDKDKTAIVGYSSFAPRTAPSNAEYLRFDYWKADEDTIMLNLGSTAETYTPYQGNTYPISWQSTAGTVYGGTLDVVSGLLTVTHANIASYNGESINEPWISSMDVFSSGGTPTTGAQVVYPLTTPQTYQLTPTEVDSLLGANNLWHDANGNTTAVYYDGDISETDVMTESGALISGEKVAYPLAAPAVSTLADTLTPTLLTGDVTLQTTPSGNIVLDISKAIPAQYPLGGALFSGVSNGDVLVFDGIDGKITKNGANAAASVTWAEFPQLEPGENVITSLDAVTVEYYPTYL